MSDEPGDRVTRIPWTAERQLAAVERLTKIEAIVSAIFERKGLGPVRFHSIDWSPNGEEEKG